MVYFGNIPNKQIENIMMNEQVRQIMTVNPVITNPNESILHVSRMMRSSRLHQIPVVEFGKLVGIFSLHDLWNHMESHPDLMSGKVKDAMNTRVVKVAPIDKVGTAAELFVGKQYKTLPVVNLRNELKGVITVFDLLRHGVLSEYQEPILFKEAFECRA